MIDYNEDLPPSLQDAVRYLRDDVAPPSDLWRRRVLNAIATAPAPYAAREATRWSVRPVVAVAACLVCVFVGGAVATMMTSVAGSGTRTVVSSAAPVVPTVRFTLVAPNARRVSLVGDFNEWNPSAVPLRRGADGRTWQVEVPLAPGRYTYAFMVDDAIARDPAAAQASGDDFGAPSSVVLVSTSSRSSGP